MAHLPNPLLALLNKLPLEEFAIYLNYARKLAFEEMPDYDFLRLLFAKVLKNNGDVDDGVFDWDLLNGKPSRTLSTSFLFIILFYSRWARMGCQPGCVQWDKYE